MHLSLLATAPLLTFTLATTIGIPILPRTCAPDPELMMTPTYGTNNSVFTICAQLTIDGSLSTVYDVVQDFPRYSQWNSFVFNVDLTSGNVSSAKDVYVGMPMTLHTRGLIEGADSTSANVISWLEPVARGDNLAFSGWIFDGQGLDMQAEHINVYNDLGNGQTEYVSWETYYGPMAETLRDLMKPNLQKGFEAQGRDLKARVESLNPKC